MGQARILGGGSGKPVNSMKVTEIAGEDIPANCFVQKLEGYSTEALVTPKAYAAIAGIWMDSEVFVACNGYIMSFKNTASVSSLESGATYPWVVLKGSRQILLGTSSIHHKYDDDSLTDVLAIKVDNDGVVTKQLESYTWTPSGNVGSIIVGTYTENFFYSYSAEATNSTVVNIYKNTVSSAGIQTTLLKTLTTGQNLYYLTPSIYIPELDWIIFSPANSETSTTYRRYAAYDMTNNEWVVNSTSTTVNLYTYLDYLANFKGEALVLPKSKTLVVSTTDYQYVYTIKLDTGEETDIKKDNPVSKKYVRMLGTLEENGYPETTLLCLETTYNGVSDNVFVSLFDLLTGVTTHITQIRNQSQYFVINNWFNTKYRGRNRFWMFETYNYTTSTRYYRYSLNDFSFAHIEIYSGKPIYGISAAEAKTGKEAAVYVADSTFADAMYTTYGITEALAAQIIDDSVDEIKQEVTM